MLSGHHCAEVLRLADEWQRRCVGGSVVLLSSVQLQQLRRQRARRRHLTTFCLTAFRLCCAQTYTQGPLPVLVLLHGAGVNGSWMLTDLPFMESADNHQVCVYNGGHVLADLKLKLL